MPIIPLVTGHFTRPSVNLPGSRLVNAYAEKTPGGPTELARIPRPGLTLQSTVGIGPISALFSVPGVFNGNLFAVSGSELYNDTTLVGPIAYDANPVMVASDTQLAIIAGGGLYVYDGVTLTQVTTFSDVPTILPLFSSVSILAGRFIYTVIDSDQVYYSDIGDASLIQALSFFTADVSPDPNLIGVTLGDELVLFGTNTVEWWDTTADPTLPFQRSEGRTYARGCAAKGTVLNLDNSLFFLGDDRVIYRTGSVPIRISNSTVEDCLTRCTTIGDAVSFSAYTVGHLFYVINIPGQTTMAYDCKTEQWAEWKSYEQTGFIGQKSVQADTAALTGKTFIGSSQDGKIWLFDADENNDDGLAKEVIVSGAVWVPAGNLRCTNVSLACVRGVGTLAVPDPIVEMRYSDDGGRTFTTWMQGSLGGIGQYMVKATWWRLGLINQPGRLIEFKVTDDVPFVVEGATYNQARP